VCPSGNFDCILSPFEAIATLNKGATTLSLGVDVISNDTSGIPDAVAAAKAADVVVLAVGIEECGSWWDSPDTPKELAHCKWGAPGGAPRDGG